MHLELILVNDKITRRNFLGDRFLVSRNNLGRFLYLSNFKGAKFILGLFPSNHLQSIGVVGVGVPPRYYAKKNALLCKVAIAYAGTCGTPRVSR